MRTLWQRLPRDDHAPSVATGPVMALTKGTIYVTGGLCVLIVVLLDPPEHDRFWLTAIPVLTILCGFFAFGFGRRLTRAWYHCFAVSGNFIVTSEIIIGHDLSVVGATMPIYLFVIVDAAFFFPLYGLVVHVAHVLLVTAIVLPRVGVPWQTVLTFDSVCVVIGFVIAYISRVADEAEEDPLTHLINRRGIDRRLVEAVERAGVRDGLCLAVIDLDGFKEINDRQGHQRGDDLLRTCAQRWRPLLPRNVEFGRYGGDEFVLIAHDSTVDAVAALADRLRAAIPEGVSASVGVAALAPGDSASILMSRADVALYQAKEAGRRRTVVYGEGGLRRG